METSDFLQADDIYKVILVPLAVAQGLVTDDEIELFIGTNSEGRQGRYYRLAAEKFGLIVNSGNYSSLTRHGEQFVAIPKSERIGFLANQMQNMPVFSECNSIFAENTPSNKIDIRTWFFIAVSRKPNNG